MPERVLLTADDMRRALVRMAHQILEANRGSANLLLVGMRTRGVPLARRLGALISQIEGSDVETAELDITSYRDDRPRTGAANGTALTPPLDPSGKRVVLVDDVLFTGRSIRAAMDAIMDLGRPERIQLAVLVDRGHRELPIRPDYVGKNVPTASHERIQVHLVETDGCDETLIANGAIAPRTEFAAK
jgi:pyrimidine operon attenuation protein/uracil phosphoribosyltransferase